MLRIRLHPDTAGSDAMPVGVFLNLFREIHRMSFVHLTNSNFSPKRRGFFLQVCMGKQMQYFFCVLRKQSLGRSLLLL